MDLNINLLSLNDLIIEHKRIENILNGKNILKKKFRKNMKPLKEKLELIKLKIKEIENVN